MNGLIANWDSARKLAPVASAEPEVAISFIARYAEQNGPSAASDFLVNQIRNHPDCVDRTAKGGHLTASVLIYDGRSQFLLTKHRRFTTWQQLGGHPDGNYQLLAVAAREGLEESGLPDFLISPAPIDIDIHAAGCPPGENQRHFDVCFGGVASSRRIQRSDESLDLMWATFDMFPVLDVAERVRRMALMLSRFVS